MKKYIDYLFIICILLIMAGGFIKPIFIQKDTVSLEFRNAYKLPHISLSSFYKKDMQDAFELAYSDQIPFSMKMKKAYNSINIFTRILYSQKFTNDYYRYIGGPYMVDDYLVYKKSDLDGLKEQLNKKIENINLVKKNLKDIDVYVYYAERDIDIDFETNEKSNIYEYIKENLSENIKTEKLSIDNLEEYKKNFYKTDHHWNYYGSYQGYKDIVKMIFGSNENVLKPISEECTNSLFNGSKGREAGNPEYFREKFCAYIFEFPEHKVLNNNDQAREYGDFDILKDERNADMTYAAWYGGDYGESVIDYNTPEKGNILVMGDSFSNAIILLLGSHFNKLYKIDLRHYESTFKNKFDIKSYVKDNDIDTILFVGNMGFFIENEFLIEGIE